MQIHLKTKTKTFKTFVMKNLILIKTAKEKQSLKGMKNLLNKNLHATYGTKRCGNKKFKSSLNNLRELKLIVN